MGILQKKHHKNASVNSVTILDEESRDTENENPNVQQRHESVSSERRGSKSSGKSQLQGSATNQRTDNVQMARNFSALMDDSDINDLVEGLTIEPDNKTNVAEEENLPIIQDKPSGRRASSSGRMNFSREASFNSEIGPPVSVSDVSKKKRTSIDSGYGGQGLQGSLQRRASALFLEDPDGFVERILENQSIRRGFELLQDSSDDFESNRAERVREAYEKRKRELLAARRPDNAISLEVIRRDLLNAIAEGHTKMARWLLKQPGLSMEVFEHYSENGYTALHNAVRSDTEGIVWSILEAGAYPDPPAKNSFKSTPLHIAASRGNPRIISMLISFGACTEAQTTEGLRPIHYAAYKGGKRALAVLLDAGCSINALSHRGWSALHYACYSNNIDCVEHLMYSCADTAFVEPESGELVSIWASLDDDVSEQVKNMLRQDFTQFLKPDQDLKYLVSSIGSPRKEAAIQRGYSKLSKDCIAVVRTQRRILGNRHLATLQLLIEQQQRDMEAYQRKTSKRKAFRSRKGHEDRVPRVVTTDKIPVEKYKPRLARRPSSAMSQLLGTVDGMSERQYVEDPRLSHSGGSIIRKTTIKRNNWDCGCPIQ